MPSILGNLTGTASQPAKLSVPAPKKMREFNDTKATREAIYDSVLSEAKKLGSVENAKHVLSLRDVDWRDPPHHSLAEQKKAILEGRTLYRRLQGTWQLHDKTTGQLLDQKTATLAQVPYHTKNGGFVINGSVWSLGNQMRLRSGAYGRVKQSGDAEMHLNTLPGKGVSHRYFLDPETGQFTLKIGQANVPLLPILKAAGASEHEIKQAWGHELHAQNVKHDDAKTIDRIYPKLVRTPNPQATHQEKAAAVASAFAQMELDPEVTGRTLGHPHTRLDKHAMLAASHKLLKIARGETPADNRDAPAYQQFLGPEDLMAERVRNAKKTLQGLLWKSTYKNNVQHIPAGVLTKPVFDAILASGIGQPVEQVNALEMLDQQMRVTRLGVGGIPDVSVVPDESRNVQPGHVGFIDLVKTPESFAVGIDQRLGYGTRKGNDSNVYSPHIDARTGQTRYFSPQELADKSIAFANEHTTGLPYANVLKGGEHDTLPWHKVDVLSPHMELSYSPLSNLVPFKSSSKGQRISMGGRFLSQALPLVNPESPLVRNRVPGTDRSFEEEYGKHAGAVFAGQQPGRVVSVSPDAIEVRYDDGSTETHELFNNHPNNRKTLTHNTPMVEPGDPVHPGQLLAKSNQTDDKGHVAIGKNFRVGYVAFRGLNFEDAFAISESAAKRLTSEHAYQHPIEWDDTHKLGKKSFVSIFPSKFSKDVLEGIDDDGVVKPGTIVHSGDPLIVAAKARDVSHKQLHAGHKGSFSDASTLWDHHNDGEVIDVVKTDKGVNVVVKTHSPMQVGDKMSSVYGDKGVVSHIFKDDEMPHDEQGRPLEILANPQGIISRTNPSQIVAAQLGKIAAQTGEPYVVEDFDPNIPDYRAFAEQELAKHGIKDRETLTDPTTGQKIPDVQTGNRFYMKLHYTSEGKGSGRGLGSYTAEGSPAKGGPEGCFVGSQRIDTMDGFVDIGSLCQKRLRVHVKSFDFSTGEWCFRRVTDWFIYNAKVADLLFIRTANGQALKVTKNHQLYRPDGSKVLAGEVREGDTLATWGEIEGSGKLGIVPLPVKEVRPYLNFVGSGANDTTVYDFTAEGTHNYVTAGALVSNSKRYALMNVNATLAHGALEVVKDAKMIRGTQRDDYWASFLGGNKPPTPDVPFVYQKFVNELKGAGVNLVRRGAQTQILALTDKDIDEHTKGRELQNVETVNWKDGMKPVRGGLFDPGLTGGHDGSFWSQITLHEPLLNPVFETPARTLLGLTQEGLENVIAGRQPLGSYGTGPKALQAGLAGIDVPRAIAEARADIASGRKTKRDKAVKVLGFLKAAEQTGIHPQDWVWSKVPVLPPKFRPVSVMQGTGGHLISDANYLYKELFDANQALKTLSGQTDDLSHERQNLYNSLKALVGLSDPVQPKLQEKRVQGFFGSIFGDSPKYSTVQRKLIGTPVNIVGLSVIVPNPDLHMDEVGLPEDKTWNVFSPFVIRRLVQQGMPREQVLNYVHNRHPVAREALVHEMSRLPVILTRAPVLHKYGAMAFHAKMVPGDALHLSPLMTKPYGADFDGDTMAYHVPATEEAQREAFEKMLPSKNLISVSTLSEPTYLPQQEYQLGLHVLSNRRNTGKRPHVFATKKDALAAIERHGIDPGDPIEIHEN